MTNAIKLLFGLLLAAVAVNAQTEHVCKSTDEAAQAAHTRLLEFRSSPQTQNYDVKYHRFEWVVNPTVRYISGAVTTYFTAREEGFQTLHFDFDPALSVTEVRQRGATLNFQVMAAEKLLAVQLPNPMSLGSLDSVSITYAGQPPATGFGSFAQANPGGNPAVWTLSEPYGARDWWPCKQDLNDKIDSIDVIVRTPAAYRAASNGLLVSELQDGADKVYHWRHRYPIAAYLVAISVTRYAVYSDFVPVPDGEPIEVLNYVFPQDSAWIRNETWRIVEIMQVFNELFGTYPFADEKYGHAQFGWGGGMEHQTMSFMGGFSHLLQAHELAHQWFGDKVTCASWEDIWLNEGFATYLEGMTYEHIPAAGSWRNYLVGKINQVTGSPGGSVWVDDTTNVNRIFSSRLTYSKGAMLLHMLRWKLGDEDFFQAIRNYLNDPAIAFGYARTHQLQAHLENQSGLDLDEFFEDWFYGQGYPTYQIEWGQSGSRLAVKIDQTTSHPSVDFFEMPVPVRFVSATGEDSIVVFQHQFSGQYFEAELPFAAVSAEFDPQLWLVSRNNTVTNNPAVSVEEVETFRVRWFPNPAADVLTLDWPGFEGAPVRGECVDAAGRKVFAFEVSSAHSTFSLRAMPAGTYAMRLFTPKGTQQQVIVKQ